jgi:MATE family multidrug resistance protein
MLIIALPMVASYACETILIFTDRLFLSRLGVIPMNAALLGGLSSFMLMTFFIGLTGYVTALAAQYLGSGQTDRCAKVVFQAVLLSLAAAPLLLASRPLIHQLFAFMAIPPQQLAQQQIYFDILVFGAFPVLLRNSFSSFFSGVGRTRVVMFAALITMLINIAANYILIFGHLGFPPLGLRGAAYGTLFSSCCGLLVLLTYYLSRYTRSTYAVMQSFHFDRELMLKLLRFGSPAGIEMFLNLLAFTIVIMLFHADGLVTATAVTIVFNWDMVSFVPLLGIQIGVVSLVGRYMGAGRPDLAARATNSGLTMALAYSSLILILFVFLPEFLVAVFQPQITDDIYLQANPLAVQMLRLAALYVLADAMMVVFSGALRGAGDTFWTMCISVTLHWMLIPVLLLVLRVFNLPPQIAWLALIAAFMVFSGMFYLRYRSGRWKALNLVDNKISLPLLPGG